MPKPESTPLRVLLITSEYPPYAWGGLARYSYEIAEVLSARCQLDVLNLPSYPIPSPELGGSEGPSSSLIRFAGTERATVQSWSSNEERWRYLNTWQTVKNHSRLIATEIIGSLQGNTYEIVFAQDFHNAGVAVQLLLGGVGARLVAFCHLPLYSGFTYFNKNVPDEIQQRMEALLFRNSSRVIVPSEFAKRVVLQIHSLSEDRVVVCPHGVRVQGEDQDVGAHSSSVRLYDDVGKISLLSVARLTEQKGLHYLPKVLRGLEGRNIRFDFTLIGKGPMQAEFDRYLERMGVRTMVRHLEGVEFPNGLLQFYGAADVLLSTSGYETFGLTLLEAMAQGCVPVAFRLPSIEELIDDGRTGLLADVGDDTALVDHIETLAKKPRMLSSLQANGVKYARSHHWDAHADTIMQIFRESLG